MATRNEMRLPRGDRTDARYPFLSRRVVLTVTLVTLLGMALAACGPKAQRQTSPTATATAGPTTVQVYFTKHPDSDSNPQAVFAVARGTTATGVHDQASFALQEMLKGPSQAERAQGYYSPFDGQLALQSYCVGEFRDFDLTLDHRGPNAEAGTATLRFCRRVDVPGDLDGPRMSAMVTSTLIQFAAVKQVVILNYQGNCFDDMQGANACLGGARTEYPVKVFFSKHPDSDGASSAVFPVNRISPDLSVATYAVKQLIAGPNAQEQQAGYYTELTAAINTRDTSTCSGADFTITLNMRGSTTEMGTATLRFCRGLTTGGIGADARIQAELQATLTQFASIKKAVILRKDGSCFGDMSTQNACLK